MRGRAVEVTGEAQADAWTAGVMPSVEHVAGGVWSVPVPIPHNPLRYVNCYVLESGAGPVLVDPGWPDDVSFAALAEGLDRAGTSVEDVHGVLISHAHSDHHGLAQRVRESSGCWVGMHANDAALLRSMAAGTESEERNTPFLDLCGVPTRERTPLLTDPERFCALGALVPDRLIAHGDASLLPGRRLTALWTPGHTPGHLSFALPDPGLLLTGDHLLPRISTHVGAYRLQDHDPLGTYLKSVKDLAEWEGSRPVEVLPGHEYRFRGVAARVDELVEHHRQRAEEICSVVAALGSATVWDVASVVSWSRSWQATTHGRRRLALAETLSHLIHLQAGGLVVVHGTAPAVWSVRPRPRELCSAVRGGHREEKQSMSEHTGPQVALPRGEGARSGAHSRDERLREDQREQ